MSRWRTETIGDCVLHNADCREVLETLGNVVAVITDPPYGNANHDGDWNATLNEHRGLESKPIANDTPDEMKDVVDAMLTQAAGLLSKKASACCCFCGGGGASPGLCLACRASGPQWTPVLSFFGLGQAQPRTWAAISQAA